MVACVSNHREVVETLLAAGADVDATSKDGKTALIRASTFGHRDVVQALLNARANIDAESTDGKTTLSVANLSGHRDTEKLLSNAGARVTSDKSRKDATASIGKSESIVIAGIGAVSLLVLIFLLTRPGPRPDAVIAGVFVVGIFVTMFALPFALIVIAIILAEIVKSFTPGGGLLSVSLRGRAVSKAFPLPNGVILKLSRSELEF